MTQCLHTIILRFSCMVLKVDIVHCLLFYLNYIIKDNIPPASKLFRIKSRSFFCSIFKAISTYWYTFKTIEPEHRCKTVMPPENWWCMSHKLFSEYVDSLRWYALCVDFHPSVTETNFLRTLTSLSLSERPLRLIMRRPLKTSW